MIFLSNGAILNDASGTMRPNVQPTAADLLIASHGDSISKDYGKDNWIWQLQGLITTNKSKHARIAQRGISGISYNFRWASEPYTNTMEQDAPLTVDPKIDTHGIPSWLCVFAGTNGMDINGNSAATEYSDFKAYIAARISAGWTASRIVVLTMLPRSGFTDATRQTFNTSLVGDDGGYGYKLARLDQDANIGQAGDDADTTYFYDGVHPTAAGHTIIATIVYNAIASFI